jgi:large subunit ribosomal protein L10
MPTDKKRQLVQQLEKMFSESENGIMADYRGLKTPDLVNLRHKLRDAGIEDFHVVKNTLARIAANNAGKKEIAEAFTGPVAIIFAKDDIIKPAKTLTEHITSAKLSMEIKCGFMSDRMLSEKDIKYLATLPPREQLIAKVLGGIQGPLYGLLNQVSAPLRGLAYVLQGRIKQLEGVK